VALFGVLVAIWRLKLLDRISFLLQIEGPSCTFLGLVCNFISLGGLFVKVYRQVWNDAVRGPSRPLYRSKKKKTCLAVSCHAMVSLTPFVTPQNSVISVTHQMHECMTRASKYPLKPRVIYWENFCSWLHQWRLFLSLWYTRRSPFGDKGSHGGMACSAASSSTPGDCKRATRGLRRCMMMGTGQSRTWTTTTTQ
jgi:hypothetical protein